jgi:hypothetical protein
VDANLGSTLRQFIPDDEPIGRALDGAPQIVGAEMSGENSGDLTKHAFKALGIGDPANISQDFGSDSTLNEPHRA